MCKEICITSNFSLAKFKEAIAEQTDLRPSNQLLLFDHDRFENIVQPLHLIHTYPRTTTYSPVFVYSKEAMDFGKLPFNDIGKTWNSYIVSKMVIYGLESM